MSLYANAFTLPSHHSFLSFHDYGIPKEYLLNKGGDVSHDGQYVTPYTVSGLCFHDPTQHVALTTPTLKHAPAPLTHHHLHITTSTPPLTHLHITPYTSPHHYLHISASPLTHLHITTYTSLHHHLHISTSSLTHLHITTYTSPHHHSLHFSPLLNIKNAVSSPLTHSLLLQDPSRRHGAMLGALSGGRVTIVWMAVLHLRSAISISIRYTSRQPPVTTYTCTHAHTHARAYTCTRVRTRNAVFHYFSFLLCY